MYDRDMPPSVPICGSLRFPVGWSAALHRHPLAELLLVMDGEMAVELPDRRLTVRPGGLVVYPPGTAHRERNAGGRPLLLLYVHARLDDPPPVLLADGAGRLALLLRWLVEDRAAGAPPEVLATWLPALRAQVRRCAAADAGVAAPLRAGMRAEPFRRHDLAALARAAGLGPRQLQRRYRAETGTTPMADLRRARCAAAADLLVSTDWPLARIAQATGFCDAFHLSKVFRRHYGLPPGRLRRRGG